MYLFQIFESIFWLPAMFFAEGHLQLSIDSLSLCQVSTDIF